MSTKRQRTATQFTEANRRAAAVILEDPAEYGGEGALIVQWARGIVADQPQTSEGALHASEKTAYD